MGGRGASGVTATGSRDWSIAGVGRLASGNVPGLTVAQEYRQKEVLGRYTPNDYEVAKAAGFSHPRDYQASLTRHIAQHGVINPVRTSHGHLDEGYHRYAAMRQLGKKTMKVRKDE